MIYRLAGAAAYPGFEKAFLGQLETILHTALPDAGFVEVLGLGSGAGPGPGPGDAGMKALLADCGLAALLLPPAIPPEGRSATGDASPAASGVAGRAGDKLSSLASLLPDGSVAYREAYRADDPEGLGRRLIEAVEAWPALPGPLHASSPSDPSLPIVLVGPMASGKTTLGTLLARRAGADFIDLDALVEARTGLSVGRIFEAEGEAGFRLRESEALEETLAGSGRGEGQPAAVIATGGGAVLAERNRTLLAGRTRVVWLHAGASALAARAAADAALSGPRRPLLSGVDPLARLSALQKGRLPFYASVASFLLPVEGRTADVLAEVLHDALF